MRLHKLAFLVFAIVAMFATILAPSPASAQGNPAPPFSCSVTRTNTTATVTWVAGGTATNYVIRRSRDGGQLFWAGRVNATTFSFTNGGLSATSNYTYSVEAQNASGQSSSPLACTNGVGGGAPVAPVSCTATRSGNTVVVTWTRAANDNGSAFVIRRSRDGGAFFWAGRVNAPATSFTNGNLSGTSNYTYQVQSRNSANQLSATRNCTSGGGGGGGNPVAPASCSVTRTGNTAVVTWSRAANDNASAFVIHRSRNGGSFFWAGRVNVPANSFTNGGLSSTSNYTYQVRARNSASVLSSPRNCSTNTTNTNNIERVIHISVDGLRPDHINSNTAPNIFRLANQGARTLNARADRNTTVTLPNHIAQVTSRRALGSDGFNITFNDDNGSTIHASAGAYVASAFDVAHDNGLETFALVGKDKFNLFDRSWNGTNGAVDTTGVNNGRDKIDTFTNIASISGQETAMVNHINGGPAEYIFWHMPAPDGFGHQFGWESATYDDAVRRSDASIGVILNLIASKPNLASTTAIVLTSDHGGVSSGPNAHSDFLDARNYKVPFIVWGPGVNPASLYTLNSGLRADPGSGRPLETGTQPVRNAEAGNVSVQLLGLGAIPGSRYNNTLNLRVN